ncbi:hypothetical protein EV182_000504 [Spiromyces aspiralis]|uniref:Uncharacterized protein n=1 Tax=Spiromyces aspiralis TaxID=68401 RepID=A0ACC1HGS8_9FUNG|nr:hypothetical protein EV182_000504 [Spiromyces aspiralis]
MSHAIDADTGRQAEILTPAALSNLRDSKYLEMLIGVVGDPYDKATNPHGIVNMGIAMNTLNQPYLLEKLNSLSKVYAEDLDLTSLTGIEQLQMAVAEHIINRHFNPHEPVTSKHIVLGNGTTALIDSYAFCVCEPGDAVIINSPHYTGFRDDFHLRARAVTVPVPIPIQELDDPERVAIYYQDKIDELRAKGTRVRCIVVCNPGNPIGMTVQAILAVAEKNNLYVLCDEIYALSVFRTSQDDDNDNEDGKTDPPLRHHPFTSVLSWDDLSNHIDPSRVAVIHGLSKDFGLSGFRVGWLISPWNSMLLAAMHRISFFSIRPTMTDRMITGFLNDHQFVDTLIATNRRRLLANYNLATEFLRKNSIPYVPSQSGHFLWLDMRHIVARFKQGLLGHARDADITFEDEIKYLEHLINDARVFIGLGRAFSAPVPGHYRLTFSIKPEELQVALSRIADDISAISGDSLLN